MTTMLSIPMAFICSAAPGGILLFFILVMSISNRDLPSSNINLPGIVVSPACPSLAWISTVELKVLLSPKSLDILPPKFGPPEPPPMPPPGPPGCAKVEAARPRLSVATSRECSFVFIGNIIWFERRGLANIPRDANQFCLHFRPIPRRFFFNLVGKNRTLPRHEQSTGQPVDPHA